MPRNQAIEIAWAPVADVESSGYYNIYWSKNPGVTAQNRTKIERATSPHKHGAQPNEEPLKNGEKYYYVVTAVSYSGESVPSAEIIASPQPPPPPPLTGLTNGVTYYFIVTGINANGEGTGSVEKSAVPLGILFVDSGADHSCAIGTLHFGHRTERAVFHFTL